MDSCVHYIFLVEKGAARKMIIKVFKISTSEMWTMRDKKALMQFIKQETDVYVSDKLTVDQLMRYLPIEDYCRVK